MSSEPVNSTTEKRRTLLIVEDDDALGQGLRSHLASQGYAVDLATNGIDGAHLGTTEPYDAVVLDLGLPGKPGLAVLRNFYDYCDEVRHA